MTLLISSCQNEEELKSDNSTNIQINLESSISKSEFIQLCHSVKTQNRLSRTTNLSDHEAKALIQPLIQDGIQLKSQIVTQATKSPTLKKEVSYFENLSDEDCAALSFIIHLIEEEGVNPTLIIGTLDNPENGPEYISAGRLAACAGAALGYNAIKEIGVGGVINAVTVRQALIAIGKRYLGYVGLALMLYDFAVCIS